MSSLDPLNSSDSESYHEEENAESLEQDDNDSSDDSELRKWSDSEEEMWSWEWTSFSGSWPRRLLHIPTLTSLERQDGNIYGTHKKPHYGILTYTWGRWRTRSGPALGVKNTTWAIPSVSAEHFSVEEFERVVRYIGQDFEFAWIDIACIDQENYKVKMDEIGNQMGIFKQARRVYAWLSRSSIDLLQASVDGMYTQSDTLREEVQRWRRATQPLAQEDVRKMIESMREILEALEQIFADPWFSSLWTLQEAVLRRDARLLSHEGAPIQIRHENRTMLLVHLVARCSKIYDDASRIISDHGRDLALFNQEPQCIDLAERISTMIERAERISTMIERAGYHYAYFCTNPNVQYSAAQFRQTKHPLDRIYGIMQLYGFRLGASNPQAQNQEYTLEDLEDEFARTLIEQSPLLGQMFVHTRSTTPGKSWRITQFSKVPYGLMELEKATICCDKFSVTSDNQAFIRGRVCELEPLVNSWDRMARNMDVFHSTPLNGRIFLDDVDETQERLKAFPKSDNDKVYDNVIHLTAHEVSTAYSLLETFGADSLRVFLLGFTGEELKGNFGEPTRMPIGLLLLRQDVSWKRIGVCVWDKEAEKAPALPADTFRMENEMLEEMGLPLIELKPVQKVEWVSFETVLN